jgi:hypothetical protein
MILRVDVASIAARWGTVFSLAQGCGARGSCVIDMHRATSTAQPLCGPQLNYQNVSVEELSQLSRRYVQNRSLTEIAG